MKGLLGMGKVWSSSTTAEDLAHEARGGDHPTAEGLAPEASSPGGDLTAAEGLAPQASTPGVYT